jgi:hypothetical protein
MNAGSLAKKALDQGKGIVRLAPNWVPRAFCIPGRRIKLHPDELLRPRRRARRHRRTLVRLHHSRRQRPLTGKDEGLSKIVCPDGERFFFATPLRSSRAR